MKKISLFLIPLVLILLTTTNYAMDESSPQQERTVIIADLDDALIQPTWWKKPVVVLGGIFQSPLHSLSYLVSLNNIRKRYQRDECYHLVLKDDNGNKISGPAFQFLYHGAQDPNFAPYVRWLVETNERSRKYVPGMKELCTYLKEKKGIDIILATNKDRVSYNFLEKILGEEFTKIPNKVFVTYPQATELERIKATYLQPHTNKEYAQFVHDATSFQPTSIINHITTQKPDPNYYNTIINQTQARKIIFVDDHKTNVDNFKNLQHPGKKLVGIHFKSSAQLAQELIDQKILSEEKDKKILEVVRYPGITGALRLWSEKAYSYFKAFFNKP